MPSGLERIRKAARRSKDERFTSLLHHVTVELLETAYDGINRKAVPGVDGKTWEDYRGSLTTNLEDLHTRIHKGTYRAKPSRRAYIPKPDGGLRPLGIASLEDKIAQGAMMEVLSAIYEEDFLGFSYGFRRGRGPHDALDALSVAIKRKKVNWILDADIRGFFDAIDHDWMIRLLEHRIGDKRVIRLVRKWLKAGIIEKERWHELKRGSPQGATISPLLANVYLHYVFDLWAHSWRSSEASGDVVIVRYADDFVVGFQRESDAERFVDDLRERLSEFHLELHPEKTRIMEFGRFAGPDRRKRGEGRPETFDFLGFTHICAKNRKGGFLLYRKPIKKRVRRTLAALKDKLRRRMHDPLHVVGMWLGRVLDGWFGYFAVPGTIHEMDSFRTAVIKLWRQVLRRRSQRGRLNWRRMAQLANSFLPHARIRHPWPEARFDVRTGGRSPVR